MSSKIGVLFSLIFVALFVVLGADLINVQYIYSELDAKSVSIAYLISQNGRVTKALSKQIEERYNVEFTCLSYCNSSPGDVVDFRISQTFRPMFISKEDITLAVTRQAIISYYG